MKRSLPNVGTAVGFVGGLIVLLSGPLPTSTPNRLVGLLVVPVASVAYMVMAFGGPGECGPDF